LRKLSRADEDSSSSSSPTPPPSKATPPSKGLAPAPHLKVTPPVKVHTTSNKSTPSPQSSGSSKGDRSLSATFASLKETMKEVSTKPPKDSGKKLLLTSAEKSSSKSHNSASDKSKKLKSSSRRLSSNGGKLLQKSSLGADSDSAHSAASSGNERTTNDEMTTQATNFVCQICNKSYPSQFGLTTHLKKKHNQKQKLKIFDPTQQTPALQNGVNNSKRKGLTKNANELPPITQKDGVETLAAQPQCENSTPQEIPKYRTVYKCSICGKRYTRKHNWYKYHQKHCFEGAVPVEELALVSTKNGVNKVMVEDSSGLSRTPSPDIQPQQQDHQPSTSTTSKHLTADDEGLAPLEEGFTKKTVTDAVNNFMKGGSSSPRSSLHFSSSADSLDDGYMAADESNEPTQQSGQGSGRSRRSAYTHASLQLQFNYASSPSRKWSGIQELAKLYSKKVRRGIVEALKTSSTADNHQNNESDDVSDDEAVGKYQCWLCKEKPFQHSRNFTLHIQNHLKQIEKEKFRCDYRGCLYAFRSKAELSLHRSLHTTGQKGVFNYVCLFCPNQSKMFDKFEKLVEHEKEQHKMIKVSGGKV